MCSACQEAASSTEPPPPIPPPQASPPEEDEVEHQPVETQFEPELVTEDYFARKLRESGSRPDFMAWIIYSEIQSVSSAKRLVG